MRQYRRDGRVFTVGAALDEDDSRRWDARTPPPLTWRAILDAAAAFAALLLVLFAFCAWVLLFDAVRT